MDFSTYKCRCSAIGHLTAYSRGEEPITEAQLKRIEYLQNKETKQTPAQLEELAKLINKRDNKSLSFSETHIGNLLDWYAWETACKMPINKETMEVPAMVKGTVVEPESVILLSIVDGVEYKIHKERISNDYLSGSLDVYVGESVMQAQKVTDIKSIWDYPTFLRAILKEVEPLYRKQVQGYCDITGATEGEVAKCLVDMPEQIIAQYKYKIASKMGALTDESPEFLEIWDKFECSMLFGDILPHKRVHKTKIEPFTEKERQIVYDRVKQSRDWLFEFHESYNQINL